MERGKGGEGREGGREEGGERGREGGRVGMTIIHTRRLPVPRAC